MSWQCSLKEQFKSNWAKSFEAVNGGHQNDHLYFRTKYKPCFLDSVFLLTQNEKKRMRELAREEKREGQNEEIKNRKKMERGRVKRDR